MSDSSKRDGIEGRDYPADPTIVGGRPLGSDRPQREIPRGIEVLVKKASVDSAFREVLLEKRALAATEIGLELSPAEAATLNSVPRSQIEQIIENTTVPDEHRRVFLGKVAAAMLAVLGLGLSSRASQAEERSNIGNPNKLKRLGGIRPDDPTRRTSTPNRSRKSAPDGQNPTGSDTRDNPLKGNVSDKEGRE